MLQEKAPKLPSLSFTNPHWALLALWGSLMEPFSILSAGMTPVKVSGMWVIKLNGKGYSPKRKEKFIDIPRVNCPSGDVEDD